MSVYIKLEFILMTPTLIYYYLNLLASFPCLSATSHFNSEKPVSYYLPPHLINSSVS